MAMVQTEHASLCVDGKITNPTDNDFIQTVMAISIYGDEFIPFVTPKRGWKSNKGEGISVQPYRDFLQAMQQESILMKRRGSCET